MRYSHGGSSITQRESAMSRQAPQHAKVAFGECRAVGHAWFVGETTRRVEIGAIGLVLRCDRCNAERIDRTDIYGNLIGRSYDLPEGYSYSSETDGAVPTRHEFRMEMFRHRNMFNPDEWSSWKEESDRLRAEQDAERERKKALKELDGDIMGQVSEGATVDAHLAQRVVDLQRKIAELEAQENADQTSASPIDTSVV